MNAYPLQEAIYDRLDHPTITSLLTNFWAPLVPIFTDVPQAPDAQSDAAFPYITIGPDNLSDFSDKSGVGMNALVQVHIWSRKRQMQEIKQIADAVVDRLAREEITLANLITVEWQNASFMRDPDGKTKHAVLLFRVLALGPSV
jgi:hypothetical protein